MRHIELLAPAGNKEIAIEAILHGADAVYMGATSHGARKSAGNSLKDIKEVVEFAHFYHAKVYITVNTIVYEHEIKDVEKLIWDLYHIGVDALIVQDMGILRMKLPPIALHASTQCDTPNLEKAKFLENVGFSQIVLARELSIGEIRDICNEVNVPVECFVHGALCVSYSGRCQASYITTKRSANRGECSQLCRLPYTLKDDKEKIIRKNQYLLSLRDFNLSDKIEDLIIAGVSSFKIEGRLKEIGYVKNVTAAYRKEIDRIIKKYPDKYCRSSYGKIEISFVPQLNKSFNRGFTHYFIDGRKHNSIASLYTPKSMGEPVEDCSVLNNGDGISYFDSDNNYTGMHVNKIVGNRIFNQNNYTLPNNLKIFRTFDREWNSMIGKNTAKRSISITISIDEQGITALDERGNRVRIPLDVIKDIAKNKMNPEKILGKLGNTGYYLSKFENQLNDDTFIPASELTKLKNQIIEAINNTNSATYKYEYRKSENRSYKYPCKMLVSSDNVSNSLSNNFYRDHGVSKIEESIETNKSLHKGDLIVMQTRYCIRRELGICKKTCKTDYKEPLRLFSGSNVFKLNFDCQKCEMQVIAENK